MEIIRSVERKNKIAVDVGAVRPQLRDRREIDDNVGRAKGLVKYSIARERSQDWRIGWISLWRFGSYPLPKRCHFGKAERTRA